MKRLLAVAFLGGSLLATACGGDDKPPPAVPGVSTAKPSGSAAPTSTATPAAQGDVTGAAKSAYDQGWKQWRDGNLQGAKASFQKAVSADSKQAAPHYSLGVVLERLGDLAGAQGEYRQAFTMKPDYDIAMGAYALSLANSGHTGEAETFLVDKKAKMPSSARILVYLSQVKSLEKDSGSAQQMAQDALRLDPDSKDAMVAIARDHYHARRLDLARYALQAILDGFGEATPPRDKDNAEAHLLRGIIEKEAGQRALAFTDFEAAQKARPDLVEATIQLGVMKLEAGNAQDAQPLLESAIKFAPKNGLAHLNLGDCYRLLGRAAEARREFDTALSMDSTLSAAHYDLGLLYLFTPSIPGSSANDQVATAIKELETYKTMRGTPKPGSTDDTDELLARAKAKQAELKQAATPATVAAPPPAASSAPARAGTSPPAAATPTAATPVGAASARAPAPTGAVAPARTPAAPPAGAPRTGTPAPARSNGALAPNPF